MTDNQPNETQHNVASDIFKLLTDGFTAMMAGTHSGEFELGPAGEDLTVLLRDGLHFPIPEGVEVVSIHFKVK